MLTLYEDGVLYAQWDDTTRTYTEYDATGKVTLTRPYTAAETAQANAEAAQQVQITDLAGQVAALQSYVFGQHAPGLATNTATAWSSTGTYPPGAAVTYQGTVYLNQSGAWLNGSYVPGDPLHPFWSAQPTTAPIPWVIGMPLTQGEYVSNGGHVYQVAGPSIAVAPSNYAPTGTISTAEWTFIN